MTRHRSLVWLWPAAALAFLLLAWLLFPVYQWNIDPDCVGYLTVERAYAAGDFTRAINGLWSPLHPFLASLGIRAGMEPVAAAHLTNALAGAGVILAIGSLARRAKLPFWAQAPMLLFLPVVLLYYHEVQLFADLWFLFLVLVYLWFVSSPAFCAKPLYWLGAGLAGGLAVYAKAYGLYFLSLHLALIAFLFWRQRKARSGKPLRAVLVTWLLLLALQAPWAVAMHHKYHRWALSNTGVLNTTWFLSPNGREYRADIGILAPPPYPDSPGDWEDPWWTRGPAYSALQSPALAARQVARVVYNVGPWLSSSNHLSPFLMGILALATLVWWRRRDAFPQSLQVWLLAWLILPLGYLLIAVEPRYLWPGAIIGLLIGLWGLARWPLSRRAAMASAFVLCGSFAVYPVLGLWEMAGRGKDLAADAVILQQQGMSGQSFVSNMPHIEQGWMLAYEAGAQCYIIRPNVPHSWPELLQELRRYEVAFFLDYNLPPEGLAAQVYPDEQGRPFQELNRLPGQRFRILKLR